MSWTLKTVCDLGNRSNSERSKQNEQNDEGTCVFLRFSGGCPRSVRTGESGASLSGLCMSCAHRCVAECGIVGIDKENEPLNGPQTICLVPQTQWNVPFMPLLNVAWSDKLRRQLQGQDSPTVVRLCLSLPRQVPSSTSTFCWIRHAPVSEVRFKGLENFFPPGRNGSWTVELVQSIHILKAVEMA